jgi:hypothetical protein
VERPGAAQSVGTIGFGFDVAESLSNALDGKLHMDLRELERLMTYVHQEGGRPRAH